MTPSEAREIAKEAYIYGFPLVDHYRIQHSYFVDAQGPEFKAPWNTMKNIARVFTPDDTSIQTPNSDTPYSFLGMDLRAEPLVLTIPAIDKKRYFSVQLIDAYTQNFDYIGSRTTGNGGGRNLVAGPAWKGEKPAGVDRVFHCETEFAFAMVRTQLFSPADIEAVQAVQAGYGVQTLSRFLGVPSPASAPAIAFPKPLSAEAQRSAPEFFAILSFVLGHCPVHPAEAALRARLASLDVGADKPFDVGALAPDILAAVKVGIGDAWAAFAAFKTSQIDTLKVGSAEAFGTRAHLKGDHLLRMAGAVLGIYGNSKEEAVYPMYLVDARGAPPDGSKTSYALRFAPGQLPPVHAFWSLTLYALPASLLYANPLKRYLINSSMLPDLKPDADGGVALHIQHASPGAARESNWLPAPNGPFYMVLRLYAPKPEALDGRWKQPPLTPVT